MLACAAQPGVPSSTRSYLHARLVGAHGLAFSTGLVRGAGQTSLALPLVALAGPEQRPLARGRRIRFCARKFAVANAGVYAWAGDSKI